MRTRKLQFWSIPLWAVDQSWSVNQFRQDRYSVAAAFELADLSNQWIRLDAESQRLVFGKALFGKVRIRVTNQGLETAKSVCFGTDVSHCTFDWDDLERMIRTGIKPIL